MLLGQARVTSESVASVEELAERMDETVGALLMTEEGLGRTQLSALRGLLDAQPAWSEVPVVLFVHGGRTPSQLVTFLDAFGPNANVTLLERPLRAPTLVSVVRSALKARQRQFEVRDLLGKLQNLNETLEERVVARTREVRRLATDLTLAEQHERERLAGVLHDHLQQVLFALRMKLAVLEGAEEAQRADFYEQALALLDDAMTTTRTLTVELFPPVLQNDGFDVALEWLASHFEAQHGLQVEVQTEGPIQIARRDVFVLLTQSVRELLFNIVKHAGTNEAEVAAHLNGALYVTISDAGNGFDPSSIQRTMSTGLVTLRERLQLLGGAVNVEAEKGAGTSVTLHVPASLITTAKN